MLKNVLTDLAKDTGLHPIQQRETLLKHLNSAANEMHTMLDCNAIQREITLAVMSNSIISLPSMVGEIIGIRRVTNDDLVDIHSIGFPRFVRDTQHYRLNGWRILGDSAIKQFPTQNADQLVLSCQTVENVDVLICGDTNLAASHEETITMDAQIKVTNAVFGRNITKIACLQDRTADITIADHAGNELAILHTNQQQTRYKLVDITECYWSLDTDASETLVDVWYKLPKIQFTKDTDAFYAGDDYDNAWYFMALFFYYAPQDSRRAIDFRGLAVNAMRLVKGNTDGKIEKQITFGPNRLIEAQSKYGSYSKILRRRN